jgi:sugar phosphate isomerase/epimerase
MSASAHWVFTWKGALAAYGIAVVLFVPFWAWAMKPRRRYERELEARELCRRRGPRGNVPPRLPGRLEHTDPNRFFRQIGRDYLSDAEELADRAEAFEPSDDNDTTTPEMLERRAAWKRANARAEQERRQGR